MARRRGQDLLLTIDAQDERPIYEQIYRQVRQAIETGSLEAGSRLPSIRKLCGDLCVSHTTAERAYLQLGVEGYVRNVPRSGYVVEQIDTDYLHSLSAASKSPSKPDGTDAGIPFDPLRDQALKGRSARWDFSFTNLAAGSFPSKAWHQLTDDVLFSGACRDLERYDHQEGPGALARQLAPYLGRTRGVQAQPEQVVVKPGTEAALVALLSLFDRDGMVVGVEEPGYGSIRLAAARLGLKTVPLPVDRGAGAFLDALRRERPTIAFTTPSHQFPTGAVLSLESRIELLKWADANGAFIIEDDSCNEYRYDVRPIPSLQSLDFHGRVVYLGNFSKVLSPSLRVSYMVLPWRLLRRYNRQFGHSLGDMPWLTQEVLARMIGEGHFEQHVNRMVAATRKRHDALLDALRREMGAFLDIGGVNSGIHFYVDVRNGMDQDALLRSALKQGANVYGTDRYWFSRPAPTSTVMVGFSAIDAASIPDGVSALKRAWFR